MSTRCGARRRWACGLCPRLLVVALALLGPLPLQLSAARAQQIDLPAGRILPPNGGQVLALSPDAKRLAYIADSRVYLQAVDAQAATEILGSYFAEGISNLEFSPDGTSVAFWTAGDRSLKRLPVSGGAAQTICTCGNPLGLRWQGDVLWLGMGPQGVQRVPATGGEPTTIATMPAGQFAQGPTLLPDGKTILFTVIEPRVAGNAAWDKAQVVVQEIGSNERKVLIEAGSDARWTAPGHLVYALDGAIRTVPFDLRRHSLAGESTVVASDARVGNIMGPGRYSVAGNDLAFVPGRRGENELAYVDREGRREVIGTVPDTTFAPRLSPDGSRLALDIEGTIWVTPAGSTEKRTRLTQGGSDQFPVWSPDGKEIVFTSARNGGIQALFLQSAEGTGDARLLLTPGRSPEHWSTQTGQLTYITLQGERDYDIWSYSLVDKTTKGLVQKPTTAELSSQLAPSGKWLAYQSNETGRYEIYVEPYPATGTRIRISSSGGMRPIWPSDDELFFDEGGKLYSVSLMDEDGKLQVGQVEKLPITGFVQGGLQARRQYDFTADRKRLLMMFPKAARIDLIKFQ
jgi:Tol biopolymer transport system component